MVRSVEDWFVRMKTSMLAETQEATAGVQAHFNAMCTGIINASYVTEDATENTGHWARAMEDLQMVGRQTVFSLGRDGRVAKLVEIARRGSEGMVVAFRRRGQGRWVSGRGSASHRPGAW